MQQENEDTKIVELIEHFEYGEYYCLVFELLGMSVYDILQKNQFTGFPINKLKIILKDLLIGIDFLHDLNITHTDLKLENIVFVDWKLEKTKDG